MKDVRSQGERVCPSSIFLDKRWEGGSSDADVRTMWCKKLRFFKIYVISTRKKGVEPTPTFCEQREEGGQFFSILCRSLLWTAPKIISPDLNLKGIFE